MKNFTYIVILFAIFQSCQKKTEFELHGTETKLVVNSQINPDSTIKVYITKSLLPTDIINFKDVRNAKVEILQNNAIIGLLDEFVETSKNPGLGYYTNSNLLINETDSFKIKISHKNYKTAIAKTIIPEIPKIKNVNLINNSDIPSIIDGSLNFCINDNIAEENYYSVNLFYNADYIFDFVTGGNIDTTYTSKIYFEINSESAIKTYKRNEGYIISDKVFNGKTEKFSLIINDELNIRNSTHKFYIEVKSITKDYYLYQKTMLEFFQESNNPFAEYIFVHGNIENGYGIFAGYNYNTTEINLN